MSGPRCRSRLIPGVRRRTGETSGRIGKVRLAAVPDYLEGKPGGLARRLPGRWPVTGVEDTMLSVQRVETASDDTDVVAATISQLYARHRPRIRRIAHSPRPSLTCAARAGSRRPRPAGRPSSST